MQLPSESVGIFHPADNTKFVDLPDIRFVPPYYYELTFRDATQMTTIDKIRSVLKSHPPVLQRGEKRRHAAVAILLREGEEGLELLFIWRSEHENDPWSGNLAFPGGKIDEEDGSSRQAAERETLEEIGVDLSRAECLGRLDDITGAYLPVVVSCYAFLLTDSPPLVLNEEVREAFWFPLNDLADPARHHQARIEWHGTWRTSPGIDLLGDRGPVLWGITYRLVMQLLQCLNLLPPEEAAGSI